MRNWRHFLTWLALFVCCPLVKCIKDIALFLSQDIDVSVSKILRQLSHRFDVIIRSIDIEERNFCANVPLEFVKEKGRTALFVIPLTAEQAPKCERVVDGNVVLAHVSKYTIKYGKVFGGDVKLQEGGVDKLMDYLNNITEYVSLGDPLEVPLWVAVPIGILFVVLTSISIFLCFKKPKGKRFEEKKGEKKTAKSRKDSRVSGDSKQKGSGTDDDNRSESEKVTESKKAETGKESTGSLDDSEPVKKDGIKKQAGGAKEKDEPYSPCVLRARSQQEMIAQPLTSKEFEVYLHQLARFAVDYYEDPCIYNVTPEVSPGFLYNNLPKSGPLYPESFETIFNDIKTKIIPGLTHWQHPNFFGYYPIGRCFPDMLADFISSALAVIGFSWDSCPALTEMEHAMINWVGRSFGLPETFLFQDSPESSQGGGTLTESGSDAIFCAVLAARQWKINQIVEEEQRTRGMKYDTIHDIGKRLVVYSSKDAHSCIEKACKLAMVRYRSIQPLEENQWGITGEQIEEQIKKDIKRDLIPCFINCTLGTTSTASCDKLTSICPVAKKYGTWLHVDAAYAGSTFIDPKYREVAEGIEEAHTINVNLSKFLLHSATLSIIWTREQKIYKDAFAITPVYLKPSAHGSPTDQRDWGLHMSRRFKALKVWFILRLCGVEGLRRYVAKMCDMASYLESLVDQHPNLQIFTARNFGLFTFQYIEPNFTKEQKNIHTLRLLRFFNESHKIFLTHALVADNHVIRVSMSYERTTKETIDSAFHIMKTITEDYKKRKGDPTLLRGPAEAPPASDSVPTDAEFFVRVAASAKPLQSKKKPNELVDNAEKSASKGNDNLSVTAPKPIVSQAVEPLPAQRKPSSNTSGQQMTVSTSGNADITGGPPAVNTTPSQTNPATNSLQQPTPRQ